MAPSAIRIPTLPKVFPKPLVTRVDDVGRVYLRHYAQRGCSQDQSQERMELGCRDQQNHDSNADQGSQDELALAGVAQRRGRSQQWQRV